MLHTIEHGYGTCAKSHIPKLVHNMKAHDPHGIQRNPMVQFEVKYQRAHMNSPKHKKFHMYWPHLQQSHTQVASFHICSAWKKLYEHPMCVQGTPPNRGLAHGAWLSMLRRRIADDSPEHVHSDCRYQLSYGCHLPLWSNTTCGLVSVEGVSDGCGWVLSVIGRKTLLGQGPHQLYYCEESNLGDVFK